MTIEALRGKWLLEIFFEKNGTFEVIILDTDKKKRLITEGVTHYTNPVVWS